MMLNPWVLLGIAVGWAASIAGAGWWAYQAGKDSEIANRVEDQQRADAIFQAAQLGAAEAIAKIEVKHVTIRQKLETQVREQATYNCRHTDAGMRAINEALTGQLSDSGKLPTADAPDR